MISGADHAVMTAHHHTSISVETAGRNFGLQLGARDSQVRVVSQCRSAVKRNAWLAPKSVTIL